MDYDPVKPNVLFDQCVYFVNFCSDYKRIVSAISISRSKIRKIISKYAILCNANLIKGFITNSSNVDDSVIGTKFELFWSENENSVNFPLTAIDLLLHAEIKVKMKP